MDAKRMSLIQFDHLPAWVGAGMLSAHLVAGILLGALYFRGLWWNARMFSSGDHAILSIAVMIGRFVMLGGLLALASAEGALPLLVMAGGILIARFGVMRRLSEATP